MKKAYLYLHTAILLAGFTGIFGKLISLNAIMLTWWRMTISGALLLLFLLLTRTYKRHSLKTTFRVCASGLLPAFFWLFFYASIKYSNVSVAVVCFCLTGFFNAIFNPFLARKPFSWTELLLSGLILAGVSLIFHFDTAYRLGIVLGVICAAFGALYIMVNEQLVRTMPATMMNYYQMLGGTIGVGLLLPVYFYFVPAANMHMQGNDLLYLLLLSAFCTIGLYVLVAKALQRIPAFTVNLSFNLEPVYSILLAMLFFRENKELNASFYAGVGLIMLSLVLQMVRRK